jgi:hypothetical protein
MPHYYTKSSIKNKKPTITTNPTREYLYLKTEIWRRHFTQLDISPPNWK